ncbi:MAG: hypothetical protein IBX70_12720 [Clostridia bacterium]|nr:hypothetical protein [Clostridia bacterium]
MAVAGFEKGIKTVETLQKALGIYDYHEFHKTISALVAEGKLKPTKDGKDTNGKQPPLAKKYRVIEERRQDLGDDLIREIEMNFPLIYNRSYYKSHLEQYLDDRDWILKLCAYHNRADCPLLDEMSINERFYDIFKLEKLGSDTRIRSILRKLSIDLTDLNCYKTPEPFIYYSNKEMNAHKILIIENKDTWYTMRKLMNEGFGPFDTIIYGEGKKILSSIEEIEVHQKEYFRDSLSEYFYFGDLDDEGLNIFLMLKEKMKPMEISLWEHGYKTMLKAACAPEYWRKYKIQRSLSRHQVESALHFLSETELDNVMHRFSENLYLPQEIVNHRILRKMWG